MGTTRQKSGVTSVNIACRHQWKYSALYSRWPSAGIESFCVELCRVGRLSDAQIEQIGNTSVSLTWEKIVSSTK